MATAALERVSVLRLHPFKHFRLAAAILRLSFVRSVQTCGAQVAILNPMKRLTRILARRRRGKNFANTTTIRRCAAILAYAACLLTRSAPLSKHKTTAEVSAISVFSAASTASSFSAAQGRTVTNQRPSCEQSDDREYTCLLSSPPGAFDDEIRLYLSVRGCDVEQQLAVKIVVSGMAGWSGGGGGRGRAWASVGFSPNGRMAGPSEAVVGVAGDADGDQGVNAITIVCKLDDTSNVIEANPLSLLLSRGTTLEIRRMCRFVRRTKKAPRPYCGKSDTPWCCILADDTPTDCFNDFTLVRKENAYSIWQVADNKCQHGYNCSEVTPLLCCPSRRFIRAFSFSPPAQNAEPKVRSYRLDGYSPSSVTPLPARDHTLTDEAVETTSDGFLVVRFTRPFSRPVPTAKITCAENMLPKDPTCGATSESNGSKSEFAWMDPREAGVVVLWAYGARTPWPSYHDATGSFVLPHFI